MENVSTSIDKSKLISNINYFINVYDMKIGELEDAIHVSQGYLSKLSKPDNKQLPSIETLANLSTRFGITIDDLLFSSYPKMTKTEHKMNKFLNRLSSKTKDESIDWEEDDYNSLISDFKEGKRSSYHPIFDLERGRAIDIEDFADGKQYLMQPLKSDLVHGKQYYLYGRCFKTQLSNDTDFYLLEAATSWDTITTSVEYLAILDGHGLDNPSYDDFIAKFTEVILAQGKYKVKSDNFSLRLEDLYNTIVDNWGTVKISKLASNVIDDFLRTSEPMESKPSGSNSNLDGLDELPF